MFLPRLLTPTVSKRSSWQQKIEILISYLHAYSHVQEMAGLYCWRTSLKSQGQTLPSWRWSNSSIFTLLYGTNCLFVGKEICKKRKKGKERKIYLSSLLIAGLRPSPSLHRGRPLCRGWRRVGRKWRAMTAVRGAWLPSVAASAVWIGKVDWTVKRQVI